MPNPGQRRALSYLPLLLALPLIWLASEGSPAVKPYPAVAAAAVVVAGLWMALSSRRLRLLDLPLAALLGVAATHLLLTPGFPRGHDIVTHLWGAYGFYQAILDGNLLPRWIHHLGVGMPFLLFYPPLVFYTMLPFFSLDLPTYDALKYGMILCNALSGLSMYFVVRRWTGSRRAALLAAGAYCFAPYHLLESHYRIAIAEAAGMAVLPLFFYYMHRAIEKPSKGNIRWAAVWTAVLTVTHPLSLSMAGTGMALFLFGRLRFKPGRPMARAVGLLVGLGILGVGLAGYYSIPVAAESQYTTISNAMGSRKTPTYLKHGLMPQQLVERRAWTKWQKSESRGSDKEKNEMPFYFGISLLVLLPLARSKEKPELIRGLLALTMGSLALTLFPFDVLFAYFPPMTMLQFSWRFLAIATCGACALAGFATQNIGQQLEGHWAQRLVPGLLFALLVFDFFPYEGAPLWAKPYDGLYRIPESSALTRHLPLRVDHLSFPPADSAIDLSNTRRVYPEYFTPTTRKAFRRAKKPEDLQRVSVGASFHHGLKMLKPKPYAEFFPKGRGKSVALDFERGGGKIQVKLPGKEGKLVIKEQWFPGWEARINTSHIAVESTSDGLMEIELEKVDDGTISLFFTRSRWDRLLGILLSMGIALWLALPGKGWSAPPLEPAMAADQQNLDASRR